MKYTEYYVNWVPPSPTTAYKQYIGNESTLDTMRYLTILEQGANTIHIEDPLSSRTYSLLPIHDTLPYHSSFIFTCEYALGKLQGTCHRRYGTVWEFNINDFPVFINLANLPPRQETDETEESEKEDFYGE